MPAISSARADLIGRLQIFCASSLLSASSPMRPLCAQHTQCSTKRCPPNVASLSKLCRHASRATAMQQRPQAARSQRSLSSRPRGKAGSVVAASTRSRVGHCSFAARHLAARLCAKAPPQPPSRQRRGARCLRGASPLAPLTIARTMGQHCARYPRQMRDHALAARRLLPQRANRTRS